MPSMAGATRHIKVSRCKEAKKNGRLKNLGGCGAFESSRFYIGLSLQKTKIERKARSRCNEGGKPKKLRVSWTLGQPCNLHI